MIYTIGHRTSYTRYFRAAAPQNPLLKLGRHVGDGVPYPGGCCFQTIEEASEYLRYKLLADTFAVYGLMAAWESDTYEVPGQPYRCLLRDSVLVDLEALTPPNNPPTKFLICSTPSREDSWFRDALMRVAPEAVTPAQRVEALVQVTEGQVEIYDRVKMLALARQLATELAAAREEIKRLSGLVISGFYEEEVPQFQQGEPTHELQGVVTAEEVAGYVKKIAELSADKASRAKSLDVRQFVDVIEHGPEFRVWFQIGSQSFPVGICTYDKKEDAAQYAELFVSALERMLAGPAR